MMALSGLVSFSGKKVSLSYYNWGNGITIVMPETMLNKFAELLITAQFTRVRMILVLRKLNNERV
jgi:hypothetical protein